MNHRSADKNNKNPFAGLRINNEVDPATAAKNLTDLENLDKQDSPDPTTPTGKSTGRGKTTSATSSSSRKTRKRKYPSSGKMARRRGANEEAATEGMEEDVECGEGNSVEVDPFTKMQAFIEEHFKKTNDNIAQINSTVQKMNEKVGINTRNLGRLRAVVEANAQTHETEVAKIKESVMKIETSTKTDVQQLRSVVDEMRKKLSGARGGRDGSVAAEAEVGALDAREAEFMRARRSIRMWPVVEKEGLDIWGAAANFVHDCLKVPRTDIGKDDVEFISKTVPRKRRGRVANRTDGSRVVDEIIVRFKTIEARDMVMSHAYNLAPFVDDGGKPTAGVRMEIPAHLSGEFQDFQTYGKMLSDKYGKGFKRHVKFDNKERHLFMEIKLPDSEEWLLVDRSMAVENRRLVLDRSVAKTKKRLASQADLDDEIVVVGTGGNAQPLSKTPRTVASGEKATQGHGPEMKKSATLVKYRGKGNAKEWEWE